MRKKNRSIFSRPQNVSRLVFIDHRPLTSPVALALCRAGIGVMRSRAAWTIVSVNVVTYGRQVWGGRRGVYARRRKQGVMRGGDGAEERTWARMLYDDALPKCSVCAKQMAAWVWPASQTIMAIWRTL